MHGCRKLTFYVGRVVIATAGFAPMPPSVPGYPGGSDSDGHRMRFSRHGGIYNPIGEKLGAGHRLSDPEPHPSDDPSAARTAIRVGPEASGPTKLQRVSRGARATHRRNEFRPAIPPRVARQQSPLPLHRHDQHKSVVLPNGTIYHRTVSSVLTGCLAFRDKRNL